MGEGDVALRKKEEECRPFYPGLERPCLKRNKEVRLKERERGRG